VIVDLGDQDDRERRCVLMGESPVQAWERFPLSGPTRSPRTCWSVRVYCCDMRICNEVGKSTRRSPAWLSRRERLPTDVIAAINFGRDNSLPIAIHGGGHNGPGLGSMERGAGHRQMRGVRVDRATRTAQVEAACTQGDVAGGWHQIDHRRDAKTSGSHGAIPPVLPAISCASAGRGEARAAGWCGR
jgi:hypothetical protein